jgi:hypothetical protein
MPKVCTANSNVNHRQYDCDLLIFPARLLRMINVGF